VGTYPAAFAEAMRMAIYGFHFRKVAEALPVDLMPTVGFRARETARASVSAPFAAAGNEPTLT